jgi:hypothetical protein
MVYRFVWVAGLATTALLSSGCGTCANFVPIDTVREPRVYGGVRLDCESALQCWNKDGRKIASGELAYGLDLLLVTAFYTVEFPLTVVADTLTIPFALDARERHQQQNPPSRPSTRENTSPQDSTAPKPELNPDPAQPASRP